jgi:hypothetical protein
MSGVTKVKPSPSTATTPHTESCRDGESDAKELLLKGLSQLSLLKQNRIQVRCRILFHP